MAEQSKTRQFASNFNKLSEAYTKRYPRIMEALKNESMLAKHGVVTEANVAQLGSMIDKTRTYLKYKNEQGTVTDLGLAAKFAIDLVTVGYTGASNALLANIQQLASQEGYVWFEATKAETEAATEAAETEAAPAETEAAPAAAEASSSSPVGIIIGVVAAVVVIAVIVVVVIKKKK